MSEWYMSIEIGGSTGQVISLLVRDDSDYDEKSYSPLGRIKKETL